MIASSKPLRLRVQWAGLMPGDPELRDTEESPEHLGVQVWPGAHAERKVVRWWSEWLLPGRSSAAPDGRQQIEGTDDIIRCIQGRMRSLPVFFGNMAEAPALPGGGPGSCTLIWGDPGDGTWWVDGYAARRVLRPISDEEVRVLLRSNPQPMPSSAIQLPPDARWSAMLARVGLSEH